MTNPWQDMQENTQRRVKSDSPYDIFWMVDWQGQYMLNIGIGTKIESGRNIKFEGLSVRTNNKGNATRFYITLGSHTNWQPFKLVCEDLIALLEKHVDTKNIADKIIQRLLKWKRLFTSKNDFGLEKQMGLFGELHFLNETMKRLGFKDTLCAWVLDKQDFLFENSAVEIKTHLTLKSSKIAISSAEQLDSKKERLYLVVYALTQNTYGHGVEDMVKEIEGNVEDSQLVMLFYAKLFERGYKSNPDEIYRFKIDKKSIYEVSRSFPKITPSGIDARISSVKYTIDLLQCTEFLVSDITF